MVPGKVTQRLDPEKWTRISKHLIWRCCGCGKKHRVKLRVRKNEIEIKEWPMKRQTHRAKSGTKLYPVRDKKGRFEDIKAYRRAHEKDLKRRGK